MKSKVLAILAVAVCLTGLVAVSASKPKAACCECVNCTCDPCTCTADQCNCPKTKAIVENPVDDSGKGYITVFTPKDYKGWATTWVTPELKSEYHYQVISTSSPLFSRFKASVKHVPGILIQRSSGAVVDEVYSDHLTAGNCCPLWKKRKQKEEQKQEEKAPVDEEEAAPAPPPPDHTALWVLLGVAGGVTGAVVAWNERKNSKKSKK